MTIYIYIWYNEHNSKGCLEETPRHGPSVNKKKEELLMYCENCGQPLLPGTAFCGNCGAAALRKDTRVKKKSKRKEPSIPLKQEFRKNLPLFLLPLLYLIIHQILIQILWRYTDIDYNVLNAVSVLSQAAALGAVSCAAAQKKFYTPFLAALPWIFDRLCGLRGDALQTKLPYVYEGIVFLLLLCTILPLLSRLLSRIIKPAIIRTLLAALVIGICADLDNRIFLRAGTIPAYRLKYYSLPFGLITVTTIVTAAILHLVCREKRKMKQKQENAITAAPPVPETVNLFCETCGTRLDKGTLFCHECGASVLTTPLPSPIPEIIQAPKADAPAKQEAPAEIQESIVCPNCRNKGKTGEIYCSYCGTPFNQPKEPQDNPISQRALLSQAQSATAKFMQKNPFLAWFSKYAVVFAMYFPIYLLLTKIEGLEEIVDGLRNVYPIAFYAYFLAILSLFSHRNYHPILIALSLRFINAFIALTQQDDTFYCTLAVAILALLFWGVYQLFSKTKDNGPANDSVLNVLGLKEKRCPLCGETIKNDDIFCPNCGNKL